jgi:tetratricopeptide (TPR) repeat protein
MKEGGKLRKPMSKQAERLIGVKQKLQALAGLVPGLWAAWRRDEGRVQDYFTPVEQLWPNGIGLRYRLALANYRLGRYNTARRRVDALLERRDRSAWRLLRAQIAEQQEEWPTALADYRLLGQHNEQAPAYTLGAAYALVQLGARQEAEALCQQLPASVGQMPRYRTRYAQLLLALERPEAVIELLETTGATEPLALQPALLLGRAYKACGQLESLASLNDQLLQRFPKAAAVHLQAVALAEARGHYQAALQAANQALVYSPASVAAFSRRAATLLRMKNYNEAVRDWTKVIALAPKDATAYAQRGFAKLFVGNFQGADEDLTTAEQLAPDAGLVLRNRGVYHLAREEHRSAIACMQAAAIAAPSLEWTAFYQGLAHFALNEPQAARAAMERASAAGEAAADAKLTEWFGPLPS